MEQVRYGIIGLGNQGTNYAIKIFDGGKTKDAVLTAMCDINEKKIEVMKEKTKNTDVTYFTDYKEMLDSGLCDAVLVEVPHYSHPEMVEECLKRNIHVICEKPALLPPIKYQSIGHRLLLQKLSLISMNLVSDNVPQS